MASRPAVELAAADEVVAVVEVENVVVFCGSCSPGLVNLV